MNHLKLQLLPEIHSLLHDITVGVEEIFQEDFVGVYLFGSLTYGDFNTNRSDIDLVSIIKSPATNNQIKQLQALHNSLAQNYPLWSQRTESSYTPLDMLQSIKPPGSRPYYGEGILYPAAEYGNEWVINLYLLYNFGKALAGPEFKSLMPPVDIKEVQKACIQDLYKEWEPKLLDTAWIENSHYQSYLVLNICRILNTVVNRSALSKKQSADWVKKQYPHWRELINSAEQWQYGQELHKKPLVLQFLKFVIDEVKKRESEIYSSVV